MIVWIAIALSALAVLLGGAALALALGRLATLRHQVRLAMASAVEAAERADEATAQLDRLDPEGNPALAAELEDVKQLLAQLASRIDTASGRAAIGASGGAGRGDATGSAAAQSMTVAVQEAVEANRIDIYLQPVVTLPQRTPRFMTASCRLRDAGGRVLPPDQAMAMVAHLGLAQELDNQMLFRCVQMVRRMKRRPRKVGLFCSLSPASLADADFFAQFSEYLESEPELADFLVFELPLAALEDAGGAAARRLTHLMEMGFHLGVTTLTTPRISAEELAQAGISFVRIDAAHLIRADREEEEGPDAELQETANRDWLSAYVGLRREGILPIAVNVDGEGQVPALLDLEVGLAQGRVFGAAELAGQEP